MTKEQDEKKQQEMMFKMAMFEQQIQQLQQQMQAVEQAIVEMRTLSLGLDELVGKKGKEIMAPIGRGIFARAQLLSEDLIVDIGDRNLVNKSIPNTRDMIEKQIEKLRAAEGEIEASMQKIAEELQKFYEKGEKGSCGCEGAHEEGWGDECA